MPRFTTCWCCLALLMVAGAAPAAVRVDASSTVGLLALDDTLAIDLVAVEPGEAMHPQALRWCKLYADQSLSGDLPQRTQRVVLLGATDADTLSLVEGELERAIDPGLPIFLYDGPASALEIAPATAIAGHKQHSAPEAESPVRAPQPTPGLRQP